MSEQTTTDREIISQLVEALEDSTSILEGLTSSHLNSENAIDEQIAQNKAALYQAQQP